MNLFILVSTIIFGFLTTTWKKSDWLNLILKLIFGVMTVYGIYLIVHRV